MLFHLLEKFCIFHISAEAHMYPLDQFSLKYQQSTIYGAEFRFVSFFTAAQKQGFI